MVKNRICAAVIILLIGCSGRTIPQIAGAAGEKPIATTAPMPASPVDNRTVRQEPIPPVQPTGTGTALVAPKDTFAGSGSPLRGASETALATASTPLKKVEPPESVPIVENIP